MKDSTISIFFSNGALLKIALAEEIKTPDPKVGIACAKPPEKRTPRTLCYPKKEHKPLTLRSYAK